MKEDCEEAFAHLPRVNGSVTKKGLYWFQMGRSSLSPQMAARDHQIMSRPSSYPCHHRQLVFSVLCLWGKAWDTED